MPLPAKAAVAAAAAAIQRMKELPGGERKHTHQDQLCYQSRSLGSIRTPISPTGPAPRCRGRSGSPKKMRYLLKLLNTLMLFGLLFIDCRTFAHSTPELMLDACVGGVGELALPGTLGALLNLALHMVQPDPLPTALTGSSAPGMTIYIYIYIFLSVIG